MEKWFFILGYMVQVAGSSVLLAKVWSKRSVYGLSFDMHLCLLAATISRAFWSFETRLMETYLAHAEILASLVILTSLSYSIWLLRHTSTKRVCWPLQVYCLIPAAGTLALFLHPGVALISLQIPVAFTMYIEALALLPQLYLMRHVIEVEPLTSEYVGMLMISRLFRFGFWLMLFRQGEYFIGLFLSDVAHTLLAVDYLNMWWRKLRSGRLLICKP